MNAVRFVGVSTALVTPMYKGQVSYEDLASLVHDQVKKGIHGLVVVGTTGESPTLSREERREIVNQVVRTAGGRVPVIAGTGSNDTQKACVLSKEAEEMGADGLLLVAPYYNKPTQEGLFQHFSAIAESVRIPIILYSIPSRCGIEIAVETVARLHEKYPHVLGIKEAGGSCERVVALGAKLGSSFLILSGDDALTLPFMSLGAQGVISVASNWIPGELVQMVECALKNDFAGALAFQRKYCDLFKKLFIEANPGPIKWILQRAGLIRSREVRLPLVAVSKGNASVLEEVFMRIHGF